MEAKKDGGKRNNGRGEIDTRPPIRSVRDAVSIFGEGVVHKPALPKSITMELEQTKRSLEKSREETELMATQMTSLKQELDNTKRQLQQLKELNGSKTVTINFDELKFFKDSLDSEAEDEEETEFQKKRCVTFADPTLDQIISRNPKSAPLDRSSSLKKEKNKKKKKFPLLPLFGKVFNKM